MKNDNGEASRPRAIRLQVMLSADEMRALDDFRFEHRMPSRAATVRELMRRGLEAAGAIGSVGSEVAQRVRVDHSDGRSPSPSPLLTFRGKEALSPLGGFSVVCMKKPRRRVPGLRSVGRSIEVGHPHTNTVASDTANTLCVRRGRPRARAAVAKLAYGRRSGTSAASRRVALHSHGRRRCEQLSLQPVAFDPFSFRKAGSASAEVDVGRRQVLQAFVVGLRL